MQDVKREAIGVIRVVGESINPHSPTIQRSRHHIAIGVAGKPEASGKGRKRPTAEAKKEEPPQTEPLTLDATRFWDVGDLPEDLLGEVRVPPVSASLVKRLGSFPFWRGEEKFLEAIEPVYMQASPRGLDALLGERDGE